MDDGDGVAEAAVAAALRWVVYNNAIMAKEITPSRMSLYDIVIKYPKIVINMIMRLIAFSLASRVMSDMGIICVMPALLNNTDGSFNQNAVIGRVYGIYK